MKADSEEDVFMGLPEGCGSLSGKVVKLSKNLSLWLETDIQAVVCVAEKGSLRLEVLCSA